jgi:SAM-dependent methyltransferase
MSRMGTTTWQRRNIDHILAAKKAAVASGMFAPSILDVGPGARASIFSKNGNGKNFGTIFRLFESAARKTGFFHLSTFEPLEILQEFSDLHPRLIFVVDREEKVIQAARETLISHPNSEIFKYEVSKLVDLATDEKFDIIFAYNVLQRTDNWQNTLAKMVNLLNSSGILSISAGPEPNCPDLTRANLDARLAQFKRIDENTYQKNK